MADAAPNVFISMGTPYNDKQRAFKAALHDTLRTHGMTPRIMNQTDYPPGSPLPYIRDIIEKCAGVIIVAYERKLVEKGVEKRASPAAQAIADTTYTTPWNHIESALAYSLDKPLFIICETGLRKEGLIEEKIDWYVNEMDIDASRLTDSDFIGRLTSWREKVRTHKPRRPGMSWDVIELDQLPLIEMLQKLSWRSWVELAAVVGALITLGGFLARIWPGAAP